MEEEARELRSKNMMLDQEVHRVTYELEALRANQKDLMEQNSNVNARI